MEDAEWTERLKDRRRMDLDEVPASPAPNFVTQTRPIHRFADFVAAATAEGDRTVLAGPAKDLRSLVRRFGQVSDIEVRQVSGWREVEAAAAGDVLSLDADLSEGFLDPSAGVNVVAAAQVLGEGSGETGSRAVSPLAGRTEFRVGDTVIHEDHGVGVLRGLDVVGLGGTPRDAARLEYHGGADLLVPAEELGKVWRYGSSRPWRAAAR